MRPRSLFSLLRTYGQLSWFNLCVRVTCFSCYLEWPTVPRAHLSSAYLSGRLHTTNFLSTTKLPCHRHKNRLHQVCRQSLIWSACSFFLFFLLLITNNIDVVSEKWHIYRRTHNLARIGPASMASGAMPSQGKRKRIIRIEATGTGAALQ